MLQQFGIRDEPGTCSQHTKHGITVKDPRIVPTLTTKHPRVYVMCSIVQEDAIHRYNTQSYTEKQ